MIQSQTLWIVLLLISLVFKTHCSRSTKSFYSTNEIWSTASETYKRPKWSQKVSIVYDKSQIWSVEGIVVPVSTKGRNDPPKPYNGFSVGADLDLDKGHVMALCNGGPDVKHNIVPQSSQWQRTGGWRKLEMRIFNYAVAKYKWDPSNIYHASAVEHVRSPGYRNLVTFNVTMSRYDKKSGEPMKYIGFVKSDDASYSFSITPGKDAVWAHKEAPQAQYKSKHEDTVSADANKTSGSATVAIVSWTGVFVFCLFATFLVYKWIKRYSMKDNVHGDYQHFDGTEESTLSLRIGS